MSEVNRSRQFDLFRPEQAAPVTVIGAGGIGSALVFVLAKMGVPDITVMDFDTVEDVNVASQLYGPADIGQAKVECLARLCAAMSGARITPRLERYEGQPLKGVVVAAVDSMAVRRQIWEACCFNLDVDFFVDTRMGGNVAQVLTAQPLDPDDVRAYEAQLFTDAEASPLPCTSRAVAYNTFAIGSLAAAALRRWWLERRRERGLTIDFNSLNMVCA